MASNTDKVKKEPKAKKPNGAFSRFITWFKDTAWIQVLLIILLIFGVMFSISPIVNAIRGAIEDSKVSTFYKNHQIKYSELETKIHENEQVTIFFYSEDCGHCETIQKDIEKYYTSEDFGKNKVIYTINVKDEDYIKKSELEMLHSEYETVYDGQAVEFKNKEYDEFKKASESSIPTPTIALYINGEVRRISLGVTENDVVRYMVETFYKDIN